MPSFVKTANIAYAGNNYALSETTTADNVTGSEPSGGIAAAKTGSLTTRTDANTGVLTMDSGHGITTGARLDVYWDVGDGTFGSRYGMVVGTVATNSVPIDGGTGTDLPAAATAIRAAVPQSEVVVVVGDNSAGILASSGLVGSDWPGWLVITQSDNTFIVAYELTADNPNDDWAGGGDEGPLAGVTTGKMWFSHGNLSVRTMGGVILYN